MTQTFNPLIIQSFDEPSESNRYLVDHVAIVCRSLHHWNQHNLIDPSLSPADVARQLYHAPFVVMSHNTEPDPIFNYANLTAQRLFEMSWDEFITLPSRHSAEPVNQQTRQALLTRVSQNGYIDNYQGVRVSRQGKRFMIEHATVWNLLDSEGNHSGQAATFDHWRFLC